MKKAIRNEIHVVLHGQSAKFRVVKYAILFAVLFFAYRLFQLKGVIFYILSAAIIGVTLHFVFRWKTKGWTKSWGLYKVPTKKK